MNLVFPPLYAIIDPGFAQDVGAGHSPKCWRNPGLSFCNIAINAPAARQLFEVSRSPFRSACRARASAADSQRVALHRERPSGYRAAGGRRRRARGPGRPRRRRGARASWAANRWVGVSTHTLEQVDAADRTSADYIAFGPIFPTATKENPDPVVGTGSAARGARAHTRKPLVAIGGITLERAAEVYRAGADSLAVTRDLIVRNDPGARARAYSGRRLRASRQRVRQRRNR